MKKLVPLIIAAILAYAILKDEKIIELTTINNNQVIFFKKSCQFESIYITTEEGLDVAQVIFSKTPGKGIYFKENTYIKLKDTLNFTARDGSTYELSAITNCGKYPTYRKFIKFRRNDSNFKVMESN